MDRRLFMLLAGGALSSEVLAGGADPLPAGGGAVGVVRVWEGRVRFKKRDDYLDYLKSEGMEKLLNAKGCSGAQVLTRRGEEAEQFVVISWWSSRDAMKQFAGDDLEKSVQLKRDSEFLLDDPKVRVYDLAYTPSRIRPVRR